MPRSFADLVRFHPASNPGTSGPIAAGAAVTGGFFSAQDALADGAEYSFWAEEAGERELFTGVWDAGDEELSRTTVLSTTGSPLDLTTAAEIYASPSAEDLEPLRAGAVGSIVRATAAPSPKYKLCDGSAYLQASYPEGFAALGLIADLGPPVYRSGFNASLATFDRSNYRAVLFADSLFVAVGDGGAIKTSADGITWTSRTSGTSENLVGVLYANSLWVAYGGAGTILTSTNGTTWTARTSNVANRLNKIVYRNSTFVGVGVGGVLTTSSDGTTWAAGTSGVSTDINDVDWDGTYWAYAGASGVIRTATDPTSTWTSRANQAGSNNIVAIIFAASIWVAIHSVANGIQSAPDPTSTWTARTASNINPRAIAFANSQFVIAPSSGSFGNCAGSSNGTAWTNSNSTSGGGSPGNGRNNLAGPVFADGTWLVAGGNGNSKFVGGVQTDFTGTWEGNPTAIAYGAGVWVIVGTNSNGAMFWSSSNGETWTRRGPSANANLTGICHDGSQWIAVGQAGAIYTSSDLVTWAQAPARVTSQNLSRVASDGAGMYVAIGAGGTILTSPDAVTWTARTSGVVTDLNKVFYANSTWVVIGASGVILTATDPTDAWTQRSSGVSANLADIAYGASKFVVVGASNVVLYSTDAMTWTLWTPITMNAGWVGVAYGAGKFLAICPTVYMTSTDGVTWAFTNMSQGGAASVGVVRGDSIFFLAGSTAMQTSEDAVTFVPRPPRYPGTAPTNVAFADGLIVGVGNNGYVWTRAEYSYDTSDHFVVPRIDPSGPSDAPIKSYVRLAA